MSEPTFGSGIAVGFKLGATVKTVATPEAEKLLKSIATTGNDALAGAKKEAPTRQTRLDISAKELNKK